PAKRSASECSSRWPSSAVSAAWLASTKRCRGYDSSVRARSSDANPQIKRQNDSSLGFRALKLPFQKFIEHPRIMQVIFAGKLPDDTRQQTNKQCRQKIGGGSIAQFHTRNRRGT